MKTEGTAKLSGDVSMEKIPADREVGIVEDEAAVEEALDRVHAEGGEGQRD